MNKNSLLSIAFTIRIGLLVLSMLMQSCNRTEPLNEDDASPDRKELTDRYLDGVFLSFAWCNDSLAQISTTPPEELAAANRKFSFSAADHVGSIHQLDTSVGHSLDSTNVYQEAMDIGNAMSLWINSESWKASKVAIALEQQEPGKQADMTAAEPYIAEAELRQRALSRRAIESAQTLKVKFGYQHESLSEFVAPQEQ